MSGSEYLLNAQITIAHYSLKVSRVEGAEGPWDKQGNAGTTKAENKKLFAEGKTLQATRLVPHW